MSCLYNLEQLETARGQTDKQFQVHLCESKKKQTDIIVYICDISLSTSFSVFNYEMNGHHDSGIVKRIKH